MPNGNKNLQLKPVTSKRQVPTVTSVDYKSLISTQKLQNYNFITC